MGFGATRFSPTGEIATSGVHSGYAPPPPANLFDAYPNQREDEVLPLLGASHASVGCALN